MLKFTPRDIQNQEFRKVIRGYDPAEVQTFLEMISDEFELLLRIKNELENEVSKYKNEIKNYKKLVENKGAKQGSLGSQEFSKREVELMLQDAELKVKQKTEQAQRELQRLNDEISFLKTKKDTYVRRLKQLLSSQVEMVKVLEIDEKEISKSEEIERRRRKGSLTENFVKKSEIREESVLESFPLESLPLKEEKPESIRKSPEKIMPPENAASQQLKEQKKPPETLKNKTEEKVDQKKDKPIQADSVPVSGFQDGFNFIDKIIDEEENEQPKKNRNRKI
ncbi:hypothetical protein AMJ80_07390 [bacterium SM23_31]|nr:MAG: hypothetical protein AMJ80_07390 [bacterium SM23_31]